MSSRSPSNRPPSKDDGKGPQVLTDRIRASEFRLVGDDETRIVTRHEAIAMAQEQGLDVLVVSLDSSPPVIRLVDYGKFKYEAEKKAREAKKRQHTIDVKEVKMGVRIDDHDYEVKVRRAQQFLTEGHKVKLTIRMKGRETQHTNLAFDLAKQFMADLEPYGASENPLRLEGRQITVYFAPGKMPSKKDTQEVKPSAKPAKPEVTSEPAAPAEPPAEPARDEAPSEQLPSVEPLAEVVAESVATPQDPEESEVPTA